jgi:hypothetical protein
MVLPDTHPAKEPPRSAFGDSDFRNAVAVDKPAMISTDDSKPAASEEAIATCHGWVMRYDCTYICYSYVVAGVEYAFAWETYWDETHRGYSGDAPLWYDALGPGVRFKVRVSPSDPKLHIPAETRFENLTNPIFVGQKQL